MKVRAKVPLEIDEEFVQFSPTVAPSLIGTTTKDGWLVIDAVNEGKKKIWLTIEKEMK
jgi:hypothetical protein